MHQAAIRIRPLKRIIKKAKKVAKRPDAYQRPDAYTNRIIAVAGTGDWSEKRSRSAYGEKPGDHLLPHY